MNSNNKVLKYFDSAPEPYKSILYELRDLIFKTIKNTDENIKWGFAVFGNPKDFTYLRFNKSHVTFGFYNFKNITDNENRLEGTGETMRHIKIKKVAEIDKRLLSKWLLEITVQ